VTQDVLAVDGDPYVRPVVILSAKEPLQSREQLLAGVSPPA
jgi:hypothetical protein